MIVKLVLTPIFELLYFAFGGLETLDFVIPTSFLGTLSFILSSASYFLPLSDLLLMSSIWFIIATFNIWWTFATWVWKMLPFT